MSEYRALYRKWRPRDFDDVCGQDGVTDILKYEVAENKLSHAYLFCGSRGTGKTSCAKILAKAVNCQNPRGGNPCNACAACISIDGGRATDVIEMDAASNNGVDDVRDLKEEINFLPAELKYRVYIIDEVHMMSGSAFNALLKTLEEPPSYVVFILATTEFHKLPTTIVSRCQRFDFRRIASPVIVQRLLQIAAAENIELSEEGARMIARAAQGGMRDAVSLLELCAGARQRIDADLVAQTVGAGNRQNAYRMLRAVAESRYADAYRIMDELSMSGADLTVFWQDLLDAYRDVLVVHCTGGAEGYLDLSDEEQRQLLALGEQLSTAKIYYHISLLTDALSDMQRAQNARRSIAEITVTRMCEPKLLSTPEALVARVEQLEKELAKLKVLYSKNDYTGTKTEAEHQKSPATNSSADRTEAHEKERTDQTADSEEKKPSARPYAGWGMVVERLGQLKGSLRAQLVDSEAFDHGGFVYSVYLTPFFAKRLSQNAADMKLLTGAIAEAEGRDPSEIRVSVYERIVPQAENHKDLTTF